MKKRVLTVLVVIALVFNFIFCSYVNADPGELVTSNDRYGGNEALDSNTVMEITEGGSTSQGGPSILSSLGNSIVAIALQMVAMIINAVPIAIQSILSLFATNPATPGEDVFAGIAKVFSALGNTDDHFTIERTVFNDVSLFYINVFNSNDTYEIGMAGATKTIAQNDIVKRLTESVAGWYYTCRTLAMMINLIVLVYVGIRMAFSTIASEEAKYKKMLIDWLSSMLILFLLNYIMYAMIWLGEFVINILYYLRQGLIDAGNEGFEAKILDDIYGMISFQGGVSVFLYSLFFWFLTAIHIKFFLTYIKRLFSVMFLTVIAPFITVTYPIDKIGDGKAQAFEKWFSEYMINVAIQPIHAAIYLVFVFTAGKIAAQSPLISMLFLLSLGRIENIVRNIFQITDSVTSANIDSARKGGGRKGPGAFGMAKMFFKK